MFHQTLTVDITKIKKTITNLCSIYYIYQMFWNMCLIVNCVSLSKKYVETTKQEMSGIYEILEIASLFVPEISVYWKG